MQWFKDQQQWLRERGFVLANSAQYDFLWCRDDIFACIRRVTHQVILEEYGACGYGATALEAFEDLARNLRAEEEKLRAKGQVIYAEALELEQEILLSREERLLAEADEDRIC